jgi:DNA-binding PadR family transcriptional regulator
MLSLGIAGAGFLLVVAVHGAFRWRRLARIVLSELVDGGEGFGLALGDRIFYARGVRLSSGSIYPLLRSLEDRGLVESREEPREFAFINDVAVPAWAKVRRVYRATPAGRAARKGLRA